MRLNLPLSALCALTCAATVLPACATSGSLAALQARVARLEKSNIALLTQLKRDQHRRTRLLDEIEQSTGFLRASGAELTARLDNIEDRLRKTLGELEVLQHRMQVLSRSTTTHRQQIDRLRGRIGRLIADLRDRAGIAILALPRDLPEKAKDWVVLAKEHFDYGEIRIAEAVAKECAKRFAATSTAGQCLSVQARIAFEEHRFADALKTLQSIHDSLNARAIPVVGKALLQISVVLEAQGKCKQAADVLKYLRAEMPKLQHATIAKTRHGTLKQRCKQGVQVLPNRTSGTKKRPVATLPDAPTADGK